VGVVRRIGRPAPSITVPKMRHTHTKSSRSSTASWAHQSARQTGDYAWRQANIQRALVRPRTHARTLPIPRASPFGTHDPARHAIILGPQVHDSRPATAARRPPRDEGPPPSPHPPPNPSKLPRDRDRVACGCRAGPSQAGTAGVALAPLRQAVAGLTSRSLPSPAQIDVMAHWRGDFSRTSQAGNTPTARPAGSGSTRAPGHPGHLRAS
jgi:hypothetical protein